MDMPLYFFHVHGVARSVDQEGAELSNDEEAWREATRYAATLMNALEGKFRPGQEWSLEVTDEARKPLYFIGLSSRRMK